MRKFKKLSTDQMWDEIVQMNERIKDDYLKYEEKIHKEFEEWFAKNSPRIK